MKRPDLTIPNYGFIGIPLYSAYLGDVYDVVGGAGVAICRVANGEDVDYWAGTTGFAHLYQGDRDMLVRWLSKLPDLPPRMLKEIAGYAGQVKPLPAVISSSVIQGQISLRSKVLVEFPSGNIALAYIMAALLTSGYGKNFAKCPECGTWFFDVPSSRPMKKFCSKKHGNRYRQREYQKGKRR